MLFDVLAIQVSLFGFPVIFSFTKTLQITYFDFFLLKVLKKSVHSTNLGEEDQTLKSQKMRDAAQK